jgi:hypothetical protein
MVHRRRLRRHRRDALRSLSPGSSERPLQPRSRTASHTHSNGQTIYITEGLCQRRGGQIEAIRHGDRVFFKPDEDHWHGAATNRSMTHIAMQEVDHQGSAVPWGEHVTHEVYNTAPATWPPMSHQTDSAARTVHQKFQFYVCRKNGPKGA